MADGAFWDYFGFTACVLLCIALAVRELRNFGVRYMGAATILGATAIAAVTGGLWVRAAARAESARMARTVEGIGPMYAAELEHLGHARLAEDSDRDEARYLALVEAQRRWLAANARIGEMATWRREADGSVRVEVDAAIARGIFGSPFVVVDGEGFWGADRLWQVEAWLERGGW